ncbi:MAG TPA: DUF4136 domain-containing protein [Candidatus Krumholzibacteriaceae bacterium]|nr:DUF4136 domain-containing protein [Candidatus Krumholzibacteriaceae bacterium]
MKKFLIPAAVVLFFLSSCSTIRVKTDFDRGADFSLYKTYRWIPENKIKPRNRMMKDELIRKHVHSAVEREMAKMGFIKAGRSKADLLITYYIGTKRKVDGTRYGYGGWRRFHNRPVSVRKYKEGTLILDFVDAGNKQLVWRGWASSVFHGRENSAEDIAESVERLLREYPPIKKD